MDRNRSLPEEVWMEIIVRLPVKSLISLKCVSKFWYALIQSPNFVSFHYHNPFNRPKLLVCHRIKSDPPPVQPVQSSENGGDHRMQVFSMFPGEFTDVRGRRDICDRIIEFEDKRCFNVVGPVEGLFMFQMSATYEVGIWNPATAEFKQLPKLDPSNMFRRDKILADTIVSGFGINPLTNEYKVVCTPYLNVGYPPCETKTSSTFMNRAAVCVIGGDRGCSWRYVDGPELGIGWIIEGRYSLRSDATYSNGFYYWLSNCSKCAHDRYKLVVFDMRTDVFTEMPTPPYLNHDDNNCSFSYNSSRVRNVVNLALHGDDDIALLVTQLDDRHVTSNSPWLYGPPISASVSIMKNEAKENWIKVYTHKFEPNICKELRKPLGIWKNNGIFFLNESTRLVLYATASEEIVDLGVNNYDSLCDSFTVMVYNYKESLVSFGGQKKHSVFQDYFA